MEPPGRTPSAGALVDSAGYVTLIAGTYNLGVSFATDTTNKAVALVTTPSAADTKTFFVIGDPADRSHPVRGLFCEDSPSFTVAPPDGGAADAGGLTAQDDALLASCAFTKLATVSIDTFNIGLCSSDRLPHWAAAQPIYNAIAARTSDVMCVIEADDVSYRNAIIAAAATNFPNTFVGNTDATTPPSNPAYVKPPPQYPPCGGTVNQTNVNAAYSCAQGSCSTAPNDPTVAVLNQSTNCFQANCTPSLGRIVHLQTTPNSTPAVFADDQCFACVILSLSTNDAFADSESTCETVSQPAITFKGQTSTMILSKYPLLNTQQWVLPSTFEPPAHHGAQRRRCSSRTRRSTLFCSQVIGPLIDAEIPYTGNYGTDRYTNGVSVEDGWEEEQDHFQVTDAIAWIKSTVATDKVPAIITRGLALHGRLGQRRRRRRSRRGLDRDQPQSAPRCCRTSRSLDRTERRTGLSCALFLRGTRRSAITASATDPQTPKIQGQRRRDDGVQSSSRRTRTNFPPNSAESETVWGAAVNVPIQGNQFLSRRLRTTWGRSRSTSRTTRSSFGRSDGCAIAEAGAAQRGAVGAVPRPA